MSRSDPKIQTSSFAKSNWTERTFHRSLVFFWGDDQKLQNQDELRQLMKYF